jgi:hypothetical protein
MKMKELAEERLHVYSLGSSGRVITVATGQASAVNWFIAGTLLWRR